MSKSQGKEGECQVSKWHRPRLTNTKTKVGEREREKKKYIKDVMADGVLVFE